MMSKPVIFFFNGAMIAIGPSKLVVLGVLALAILRADLVTDWRASLPADVPNYFFINIPPQQREQFTRLLLHGRIGHACLPPFQFHIDQHPTAVLEVAKVSHPWRLLVVVKGRHGVPMVATPWQEGPGNARFNPKLCDIHHLKL